MVARSPQDKNPGHCLWSRPAIAIRWAAALEHLVPDRIQHTERQREPEPQNPTEVPHKSAPLSQYNPVCRRISSNVTRPFSTRKTQAVYSSTTGRKTITATSMIPSVLALLEASHTVRP